MKNYDTGANQRTSIWYSKFAIVETERTYTKLEAFVSLLIRNYDKHIFPVNVHVSYLFV